jgi:hypothetical protein
MKIRNDHYFDALSSVVTLLRTDRYAMGRRRRLTATPQLDEAAPLRHCRAEPGGEA